MGTDQIMYCIVALILGMLMFHMLKNVCGCKTVEGKTMPTAMPTAMPICTPPPGIAGGMADKGFDTFDSTTGDEWWTYRACGYGGQTHTGRQIGREKIQDLTNIPPSWNFERKKTNNPKYDIYQNSDVMSSPQWFRSCMIANRASWPQDPGSVHNMQLHYDPAERTQKSNGYKKWPEYLLNLENFKEYNGSEILNLEDLNDLYCPGSSTLKACGC